MLNRLRNDPETSETGKVSLPSNHAPAALIVLLVAGIAGCANSAEHWTRYEHVEWGYSVPYPQLLATSMTRAWRELRVKDADLAFRGPGGAFMTISSQCGKQSGDPAVLARQLLVGLENRKPVSKKRFEFAGGQAYTQTIDSSGDERAVRTKTVTLVRGDCVVDWLLTALGSLADVEASFDVWWRAFDPGSMPESTDHVPEMGR